MSLSAGTRLGPYEILAPIGAGGMGEVYRANDRRLDRIVAIKVLPAHVAQNAAVRQRFEREARVVSSLNHPHICVLHDVGHQDGIDFLVMEYLEGENLAARLSRGRLSIEQTLEYAIQIAGALAAAHRRGIAHRDLKPGNIMLTKSGAKLLDFGLAKLNAPRTNQADIAASLLPTVSQGLTQEGTILGTLQYMAPEQLEGKETDARADIFAFGAVLYEMVTGRKAFEGQTQANVIGAILHTDPPPLSALQPLTQSALDRVVRACLAKDPDERWQTAHDLKLELQWIKKGPPTDQGGERLSSQQQRVWWLAVTGFLLLVTAAAVWIANTWRPTEQEPLRFSVSPPQGESFVFATNQGGSAISPDGRILAVAATSQGKSVLWLRRLDALVAKPLAGTEGGYYPFWSPDSRFLGFFASGKLKKIEIRGGLPQTLCDAPEGRGGTWNRDGVIVFTPVVGPAYRISAAGGAPLQLTKLDAARLEDAHYWPWFLPDGRHFLYFARNRQRENDAIFVGSVDASPETQKPIRLMAANSNAVYAAPRNSRSGYLLFALDQTLTARRFDATRLQMEGESVPLAEEVGFLSILRRGNLSVSTTGVLVYGGKRGQAQLTWIGRDGKQLGTLGAPANFEFFSLSPDDKRVAVDTHDLDGNVSMWMVDASRGTNSRLSVDRAFAIAPHWSPDGEQIAFTATTDIGDVNSNIYYQSASGAKTSERLTKSAKPQILDDWSGDGRFLVYTELDPRTRNDLWVLPLSSDRKPVPFLTTQFDEKEGKFAPTRNGSPPRWLAYTSDETGKDEVYVQSFPASATKMRISTNGGSQPRWRRDGKELLYMAGDGTIMGVPVTMAAAGFQAEAPTVLCRPSFAAPLTPSDDRFEVSADGRRFLILAPSEGLGAQGIHVVVNWDAELQR